jgi:hypothetical protein
VLGRELATLAAPLIAEANQLAASELALAAAAAASAAAAAFAAGAARPASAANAASTPMRRSSSAARAEPSAAQVAAQRAHRPMRAVASILEQQQADTLARRRAKEPAEEAREEETHVQVRAEDTEGRSALDVQAAEMRTFLHRAADHMAVRAAS